MPTLVLEIPVPTPSANVWAGRYSRWRYRTTKAQWIGQIGEAYYRVRSLSRDAWVWPLPPPPGTQVRCTIERITPRENALDLDNAYGGAKPVIDALRQVQLLGDDTVKAMDLVVRQPKGSPARTRITLELGAG